MNYTIIAIISYLVGSLPTAYILMKKFRKTDITQTGSGNVGALNSLRVSNSKWIGASVLLIDLLKGMLAVWLSIVMFEKDFIFMGIALVFVVTGHCYSPWLKFKGGRGLASAAGGTIVIAWPIITVWLLFWAAGFLFRKHVGLANIMATVLSIAIVLTSSESLNNLTGGPANSAFEFSAVFTVMLLVILSKHYYSLKDYLRREKEQKKD